MFLVVELWADSDWTHINDVLKAIVSKFTEASLIEDANRLFVQGRKALSQVASDPKFYVPEGAKTSVLKGLETARERHAWVKKYESDIQSWLTFHFQSSV